MQAAIERLQRHVRAHDQPFGRRPRDRTEAGDLALLSVPLRRRPERRRRGRTRSQRLRNDYIPQALRRRAGAEVLVTRRRRRSNLDFFDLTDTYTPIVFAFVLGLSFLLLMLVFRSIVVPVKAIIMNLLSVGAAYGLLVLVFQKGVGADLLGFQQVDAIEAWLPLFLFSILFGLSMDYHVFLLSRIRERFDQTGDNTESVAFGAALDGAAHHRRGADHGRGLRRLRHRATW